MHPAPSYRHVVTRASGDFSLPALYEALDERRTERGLTWAAVAREVSRRFAGGPARAVSSSTITGVRSHAVVEGDGVLQMLLWLDRSPESFVPGHPLGEDPTARLVDPGEGNVLRWDAAALHAALDERRTDLSLTWADVAAEVVCAPTNLTSLRKGGRVTLPFVMRPVGWLDRPATAFTHATPW
jgi:hypothetical protein